MVDKEKLNREFLQNNPNLSRKESLEQLQNKGLGIRKTNFLKIFREVRKLPEPSIAKREASIPIKHRTPSQKFKIAQRAKPTKPSALPKVKKPTIQKKLPIPKIPFEKTKFGKMTKSLQKGHKISERNAIERLRLLLKLPKDDYDKLNQIDQDILAEYGY